MEKLHSNGHTITFRSIRKEDNEELEQIIRLAMTEFNANPQTTIIGDPALKTMFENFQKPRAAYFIVEVDGHIAGGCGIAQLDGGEENICELQRMFLDKEARELGIGKWLLEKCLSRAKEYKYSMMYLETLSEMKAAIGLYKKFGFVQIDEPLGSTGHSGCNVYQYRAV